MEEDGFEQKRKKNNQRRAINKYLTGAIIGLVAVFGLTNAVFAQKSISMSVGKKIRIKKFDKLIDPESLVVDYNPQTNKIDKIPSIAKIILSEDGTELLVEGLKEGETAIGLKLKDVELSVMGSPNESPLEQGDLSVAIIKVRVGRAEAVRRPDKAYVVSRETSIAVGLDTLLGAKFSPLKNEGDDWRAVTREISPRGLTVATAEVNTKTMQLEIKGGQNPGESMTVILRGEEITESGTWREVICQVKISVRGQKAKPPTTPEEIRAKLNEIKPQIADLDKLSSEEKTELLNELEAMEKRIEAEINKEEADNFDVTPLEKRAKEQRLKKLRDLINELRQNRQLVKDSLDEEKDETEDPTPVFDALKQRYERELKPAAANAENLSDAQKSQLRREWGNIPDYLEQRIGEERNSLRPRANLLREMEILKKAIIDDLKKLEERKNSPLVMIHYSTFRRQDAERAAEILKKNGYRVTFDTLGNVQIPAFDGKILYAPSGNAAEANKIAALVRTITAVTPKTGNPTAAGEPWVYFLVVYDPNGFR